MPFRFKAIAFTFVQVTRTFLNVTIGSYSIFRRGSSLSRAYRSFISFTIVKRSITACLKRLILTVIVIYVLSSYLISSSLKRFLLLYYLTTQKILRFYLPKLLIYSSTSFLLSVLYYVGSGGLYVPLRYYLPRLSLLLIVVV